MCAPQSVIASYGPASGSLFSNRLTNKSIQTLVSKKKCINRVRVG